MSHLNLVRSLVPLHDHPGNIERAGRFLAVHDVVIDLDTKVARRNGV